MALVTAVVVLLVGTVGLIVLGNLATPSNPAVDIDVSVGQSTVTVEHHGGAALATNAVEVVIRDGTTRRYTLDEFSPQPGDPALFEPGEALTHGHSKSGRIRVTVVHRGDRDTVLVERVAENPP